MTATTSEPGRVDLEAMKSELEELVNDCNSEMEITSLTPRIAALLRPEMLGYLAELPPDEVDHQLMKVGCRRGLKSRADKVARVVAKERRRRQAEHVSQQMENPTIFVREMVPDLEARIPDLVIPFGFALANNGLYTEKTDKEGLVQRTPIARSALVVEGVSTDLDDESEVFTLGFSHYTGWRRVLVPGDAARDGRKLHPLIAAQGFNAVSQMMGSVAKYVADFQHVNRRQLPTCRSVKRMGYLDGGRLGFMAGMRQIAADGSLVDTNSIDPRDWPEGFVRIMNSDTGTAQVMGSVQSKGSLDDWLANITPITNEPIPMAFVGASLAAALVRVVSAPNFVMDLSGRTSGGKTTTARVAASVWGNPTTQSDPDTGAHGYMRTWNATHVGIERLSGILMDMPLILDDTKTAAGRRREDQAQLIARTLYAYANSQGRARGGKEAGAMRATSMTRGVLITTGEAPTTSFSKDAGTRARVLSVNRAAFPPNDPRVDQLNNCIGEAYGTAGPAFVSWLLRNRNSWHDLRLRHRELVEDLHHAAQENVAKRLAAHAASVLLALELAEQALGLRTDLRKVGEVLMDAVVEGQEESDQPSLALAAVYAWASANQERFEGRRQASGDPPQGWLGVWQARRFDIAFVPQFVNELLASMDHHPPDIINEWAARGWLERDGRHLTKKTRFAGQSVRLLCITLQTFKEVVE